MTALEMAQQQYEDSPENAPQVVVGYHYCSSHDRIEENGTCEAANALGEDE